MMIRVIVIIIIINVNDNYNLSDPLVCVLKGLCFVTQPLETKTIWLQQDCLKACTVNILHNNYTFLFTFT